MKKTAIASALLAMSLGASQFAMADQKQEIKLLKERLEKLEAQQESLESKQKSQAATAEWLDRITLSGLIEIEASYSDPDDGSSESDLVVATVEVGLEAAISDSVSANILFLYEEDETDLEVDVATLNYVWGETGFSFSVGQDYVPFGSFETHQINDTLALEIGETRETAFTASYESGLFAGSVFIFNGDEDENGQNTLQNFGVRLGVATDNFGIGVDYISNLGDSDTIQDADGDVALDSDGDSVDGASFYASAGIGNVTLLAEYLTAFDEFSDSRSSEPEAFQLEAAIEVGAFTYALTYEETDEAAFLELPEERISFGVSTQIFNVVDIALQLQRDNDYSASEGGSDNDTNSVVLQLAAEF